MATEVDIEVDPRTLILEVKKHPVLYDKNVVVTSMLKDCRTEQWNEVCANIVDGWPEFSAFDQSQILRSLQMKWKNIRDSYLKDLKGTKQPGRKKRRPYIFSDILSFVNPAYRRVEEKEDEDSVEVDAGASYADDDETRENDDSSEDGDIPLNNIKKEYLVIRDQESQKSTEEAPQPSSSVVRKKRQHDVDEDEYFLLSLLPTFRRMSEDQKFEARMEILSSLKRIRQNWT